MSVILRSMFFDDDDYYAEDFVESNKCTYSDGILPNADYFKVAPAGGMDLAVFSGRGWGQGHNFVNPSTATVTPENADGVLNRIDRIVIRVDYTQTERQQISLEILTGELALNPVAPTLTRDGTYHELGICDVKINAGTTEITQDMLTDTRADVSLCGWAGAYSASELDFEELRASKADKTTVEELTTNVARKADTSAITDGTVKANANRLQDKPISETAPTKRQILRYENNVISFDNQTLSGSGSFSGTVSSSNSSQRMLNLGFKPTFCCLTINNTVYFLVGTKTNIIPIGDCSCTVELCNNGVLFDTQTARDYSVSYSINYDYVAI